MFGTEEQAGPAFIEAWARTWWPVIALAFGVLIILAGAILFSP